MGIPAGPGILSAVDLAIRLGALRDSSDLVARHLVTHGFAAPKFGSAGSGGAEYEQIRKDDLDRIREQES